MLQRNRPSAKAVIRGGESCPQICGEVLFFQTGNNVTVRADISNLPDSCSMFHGFHIHGGDSCGGKDFSASGGHFDLDEKPHPMHSGDMPPLLSYNGHAFMEFRTNRFSVCEITGKTVVIHSGTDDFRTQPSGNAGEKIACGIIHAV